MSKKHLAAAALVVGVVLGGFSMAPSAHALDFSQAGVNVNGFSQSQNGNTQTGSLQFASTDQFKNLALAIAAANKQGDASTNFVLNGMSVDQFKNVMAMAAGNHNDGNGNATDGNLTFMSQDWWKNLALQGGFANQTANGDSTKGGGSLSSQNNFSQLQFNGNVLSQMGGSSAMSGGSATVNIQ